jgi:hypothetical protein
MLNRIVNKKGQLYKREDTNDHRMDHQHYRLVETPPLIFNNCLDNDLAVTVEGRLYDCIKEVELPIEPTNFNRLAICGSKRYVAVTDDEVAYLIHYNGKNLKIERILEGVVVLTYLGSGMSLVGLRDGSWRIVCKIIIDFRICDSEDDSVNKSPNEPSGLQISNCYHLPHPCEVVATYLNMLYTSDHAYHISRGIGGIHKLYRIKLDENSIIYPIPDFMACNNIKITRGSFSLYNRNELIDTHILESIHSYSPIVDVIMYGGNNVLLSTDGHSCIIKINTLMNIRISDTYIPPDILRHPISMKSSRSKIEG